MPRLRVGNFEEVDLGFTPDVAVREAQGCLRSTMCSGRVSEDFVLHAFKLGAPVVLVSGCHFADCHYINANRWTVRRVDRLWNRMERLGIRPERLALEWMSAAEGARFAQVMTELETLRTKVTAEEIAHTRAALEQPSAEKAASAAGKGS